MNTSTTDRIAELERELAALRADAQAELKARAALIEPVYQFTIERHTYDRGMAADYVAYTLKGTVTNADELSAVGKSVHSGGGGFIYDRTARRFVCTSAGSFFTPTPSFSRHQDVDYEAVYAELASFVAAHPDGGDVTEIVNRIRAEYK